VPIWQIECPNCGGRESRLISLRERDSNNGWVPCAECGTLTDARPTAPVVHGGERTLRVGGRTFSSAAAVDAYAEKAGMVPVDKGSDAYKDLMHRSAKGADDLARKHGFRDAADRAARQTPEHAAQHAKRVLQQKIDRYHDKHGNADKMTVEQALSKGKEAPHGT